MTKMWRGPSEAMKAALSDPLYVRTLAHLRRHGVQVQSDGRDANAYTLWKIDGTWVRRDIGRTGGTDPLDCVLRLSHDHTPFNAEIIAIRVELLARRLEAFNTLARAEIALCAALDDLREALRV